MYIASHFHNSVLPYFYGNSSVASLWQSGGPPASLVQMLDSQSKHPNIGVPAVPSNGQACAAQFHTVFDGWSSELSQLTKVVLVFSYPSLSGWSVKTHFTVKSQAAGFFFFPGVE